MKLNPHLQDEVWRRVGEEVARKEYSPGPMAKAVAQAKGNRDLVQSLYIEFRCEELGRQFERELANAHQRQQEQAEAEKQRDAIDRKLERWGETQDRMTCPHCGYRGTMVVRARGNALVGVLLCLLCVIPGIIYFIAASGYKAVCPSCNSLVKNRL